MTRPLFEPPKDWRVATLEVNKEGGVIIDVGSGSTPPTDVKEYWDGHYPWLTPKEMTSPQCNRYIRITERSVTEEGLKQAGGSWPAGTVLLTKRAPVGAVAFNDVPMAINQGILAFRCGEILLPEFLFYWLKANGRYLDAVANGSTYPELYPGDLFEFEISFPSINEQSDIVNILGLLDEKIELNYRMNETLEAMAQAIFKSWFIDFDPVRAKSEGGHPLEMDKETAELFPDRFEKIDGWEIPMGWRKVFLPEVIEVNPKRTLRKAQLLPYLDMQNVPLQGHRPIDWILRPFDSGTKFINGDTLMARITPCLEHGKTIFVDFLDENQVGWGSTEYIVFRPKPPLPLEYGYLLARNNEFRSHSILNMTGSSGRLRVPAECFNFYTLVIPTEKIAKRFGEIIKPLFMAIKMNDEESRTLIKIRDILLPRLISGKLRLPYLAHLKEATESI